MLGELNETQINNLLLSQAIGRIGCVNGKLPYIVPVTYVFDGKDIYGQTHEGTKLDIMRRNPNICFQVDTILNMANWQSVVVFGTFRELKGKAATKARDYLYNRVLPLMTSSTIHSHEHQVLSKVDDSSRIKPLMYQIKIKTKTGRFEKQ
jgi:nitroimidazol reductase NimA-like FMN-containing flavoprotein (pyridoxamine 5'-phosphate oxidase superfamily)